ncbi:hypothetical protein OAO65_01625 [Flavobacteriales bacterium]|nr:hypothetical protein [Flavobacteriales bacterium]
MIFLRPRTFALASDVPTFLCVLLTAMLAFGAKSVSAQTTIYSQDFESFSDGQETSSGDWTTDVPSNADYFAVYNNSGDNQWWGDDTDGAATWTSPSIDVSGFTTLALAIFLGESGSLENDDFIRVSYVLDGVTTQLVEFTDDFGTSSETGLSISDGSSLQIQVVMDNNDNNESHYFDDIVLTGCEGCVEVFYEPFTDDSQFTKNVAFSHDGDGDYWGIHDPDGNDDDFDGNSGQPSGIGSFNGVDGNFLVGEDMNKAPVVADPGILTWSNIDISSVDAALTFELDIAERGANNDEYVELYAKLSSATNYTLLIDPGGGLSSIGSTLSKQTASGTFDGTSLDIQLKMYSDDGGDEVAVDDLRVIGTSSCTAVAVTSDAPTVSLDGNGSVSVSADTSGAEVTVSSTGDCLTVSSYEISKTNATTGFASSVSFDCTETGAQDVWVRATDGTDVSAATATTVTVQDVTPPTIGALSGTYYLGEGGGSTASTRRIWWATATDGNGDNCGLAIKKVSKTGNDWGSATNYVDFDCTELGPQTLYLQGTDAAGNVAEGSGTITIADNTPPTITAPGQVNATTSAYGGTCSVTASFLFLGSPTTSDNCSVASVTNDAPSSYPLGTTVVTWTVTDASGITATATQDVVVTDDQIPTTPTFANGSFQLSLGSVDVGVADLSISSSDNCTASGDLTIEISRTAAAGTWGSTVTFVCADATGAFLPIYVRATDASSNVSANGVGYVTITDPSVLQAIGQDVTVVLDADGSGSLTAAEVDNGSEGSCNSSLSIDVSSFDCTDVGSNSVVLTISDGSNSDAVTVTATVVDNTAPNATQIPGGALAKNLNSSGTGTISPGDVYVPGNPIDRCTADQDLTTEIKRAGGNWASTVSVDCNDVGTPFTVDARIIDEAGNEWLMSTDGGGVVTVTISDVDIPTISNVSSGLTEGLSSAGAATIDAATYITASDNCTASGSLTYEISESTGSGFAATFAADCDDIGAKTFYFRVTDASGKVSSESSETITIADNTDPTAVANAVTLFLSGGTVTLNATDGSFNTSTDACGVSTSEVKLSSADDNTYASSLTFTSEDDYDVTLRVTDASGNDATSTATVSVLFTVVNGCIDQTACNYDASANTDDGSCTFPGEECSSPTAGQGFVYTVNAAEDGCDCTAQDFEQLYFEDFTGDLNSGVVDGTTTDYVSLCPGGFSPADGNWLTDGCDDGTTSFTNGAFANAFVYPEDLSGNPSDLSLNWYATGGATTSFDLSFKSKLIDVQGYTDLKFDADVVNLFTDDSGVGLEFATLFDDVRTVQSSVSGSFGRSGLNTALSSINADDLVVEVRGFGDGPTADLYLDDVTVAAWGKEGCTDSNASSGYDATAQVDDGSCVYAFTTAYSRYDGGFEDKLWAGTSCGGDCGSAPYFDAKQVAANSQTSSTSFNYVISSGTTVTVNGTTNVDGAPTTKDLFVNNLTIEDGGSLVIPAGKRLRVMGTFIDNDGNAVSGNGMLCIDGTFTIGTGEGSPSTVNVQDFELPPSATLTVPENKTLAVNGNLAFGSTDPSAVSGLVSLSGSSAQTITGDGATLDELEISNSAGVTVNDSLEIQGRLKLASGELDLGDNILVFASNSESGSEEKTAVLDAIPSGASLTGTLSSGGRMAQSMSSGDANVVVERYISADTDNVTFTGYTLFGSPIDGAVVGDLDGIDGFYLAGWPGTSWPNSFSSILFWDETNSAFVEPASNNTPLDTLGGAWIVVAGSQTPTMSTAGALNSHVEGDSKTFSLTRSDNSNTADEFEGWNLIYNPYQARLDWHQVLDNSGNAALVEDQYAVYDTQTQQFVRYSETNTSLASASRYIEPGQSFWVRLPSGTTSGTFTLTPDMIDNDAAGAEFVRSAAEAEVSVLLETRNAYGATQSLLRFSDNGDAEAYLNGDLSRLGSSSVKSGELAFWADGQQYVAKTLPQDVDGEFYVRSRANFETTIRVLEVTGAVSFCGHIEDGETGEVMLLQEGEELVFTLPAHDAEAGRFTLHGERFAEATGLAPDCPDSEAGMIVAELGEVVADLTVVNYETMEQVGLALQATGTIEFPMSPGEYSIVVEATEETSLCRGGRRQVVVAPGEQPELLGLSAETAECNVGMASLAFELYGNGEFETSLIQGAQTMWSASLAPGEHVLEDIVPGDYLLKVNHACMEYAEWVSLSDPGMPEVTPIYPFFTEVEAVGGAWLEASCMGCITGEGFGYQWMVDGEAVNENEPMAVRVYEVGLYGVELVAFGPDCQMNVPFEMLVGQHKVASSDEVTWVIAEEGQLMGDFKEEWVNAQVRWFDSTGRLLKEESKGSLMGRVMLDAPKTGGWLTLEVRSASGRLSRWFGVH